MSKEEVIAAIKKATEELGHVPSLNELAGTGRVSKHAIRRHFGQYLRALDACGLERNGHGYKLSPKALFEDWMRLARQLGKIPSIIDYDAHGRYSVTPLRKAVWRVVKCARRNMAVRGNAAHERGMERRTGYGSRALANHTKEHAEPHLDIELGLHASNPPGRTGLWASGGAF
jgi:hypothetical protein